MQSFEMADPSVGSSSPNWASIISNGPAPNFINVLPEMSAEKPSGSVESSESADEVSFTGSGDGIEGLTAQMSPYAPVFHPMGSYASHLLAMEQATQINMNPLSSQSSSFFERPETYNYSGSKEQGATHKRVENPTTSEGLGSREYVDQQRLIVPLSEDSSENIQTPQLVPHSHDLCPNGESQREVLDTANGLQESDFTRDIEPLLAAGLGEPFEVPPEFWREVEQHIHGIAPPQPQTGHGILQPTLKQWQDLEAQLVYSAPQLLELWTNAKRHSETEQSTPTVQEWPEGELLTSGMESHGNWGTDNEQKPATQRLMETEPKRTPQSEQQLPLVGGIGDCTENESATVSAVSQQAPSLPLYSQPYPVEAEQEQKFLPSREWWQAAAFTPDQELGAVQSSEWLPYSYAPEHELFPMAEDKDVPATTAKDKKYEPSGSTESTSLPRPSQSSSQSNLDFPPFEDFAKQVNDCSLSSSEYIATLRNLMIRAHNLMLPLFRGRFASMTQVQMAAYTTAILEVTPLHPCLFLPSSASQSATFSAGVFTPCNQPSVSPQDRAFRNPRPSLVNATTQTEYHCWCMHMSMYPPPSYHVQPIPPPPPPPPRSQGNLTAHFAPPTGPRMMAPCATAPLSFWGRPMVPMHPYSHSHQMPYPHGSRYGYRINTYSMPYRFAPVGSSRIRPMGNMQQGPSMYSSMYGENTVNLYPEKPREPIELRELMPTKPHAPCGSFPSQDSVRLVAPPSLNPCLNPSYNPSSSSSSNLFKEEQQLQSVDNSTSGSQCGSLSLGTTSESSSIDSKIDDFNDKQVIEVQQNLGLNLQPEAAIDECSYNQLSTQNNLFVKQVNNIFLQPTGPLMPTMPMMPMMHFMVPPSGGHTLDSPYMMYDGNENHMASPNFAPIVPNLNMNMNMNMNMNLNVMQNSVNNLHLMPSDPVAMPEVNYINPSLILPLSSNLTTFRTSSMTFTGFDLEESNLTEILAVENGNENKEELSELSISEMPVNETDVNHEQSTVDDGDQSVGNTTTEET